MPKFKVGDRVRVIKSHIKNTIKPELWTNKIYEITYVTDGKVFINNEERKQWNPMYLELVEDTYMPKFKVGDIVRVIRDNIGYKIGTIFEIQKVNDLGKSGVFYTPVIFEGIIYEGCLKLADEKDIERYKNKVSNILEYYNKTTSEDSYVSKFKIQIDDIIPERKRMFEEGVLKAHNSTVVSTPTVNNSFYNLNEKPMTLADKIFERFLKSNEKKVIEATEKAEAIQEEITPLLKPFNELSIELAETKQNLEKAFDKQDKEFIKFYLRELQEINAIFDDKLFDQLKTVLKAINKSLSL